MCNFLQFCAVLEVFFINVSGFVFIIYKTAIICNSVFNLFAVL